MLGATEQLAATLYDVLNLKQVSFSFCLHTVRTHPTQMADPDKWTLNLPPGPDCSVGYSSNEFVSEDGSSLPGRENEDK